jgi:plasmid maintenance system antidote protein VapI
MSMKLNRVKVEDDFEDLFSFSDKEDRLEHRAQMISYRILSEIEKLCEEKQIKKKELAAMVDTSASYITQLFRGDKQVNTAIMSRFEEAFDMVFDFVIHENKNQEQTIKSHGLPGETLKELKKVHPDVTFYYAQKGGGRNSTARLLEQMQKEEQGNQTFLAKQIV